MPLKDTAYQAPEGHLDTFKTNTAYDPLLYAVSRLNVYSSRSNTQYTVSIYPIRRIQDLNEYSGRIKDIERGPYSKSTSIRRIAQVYTPYRPPEQPVYKEITPDDLGYAFNHQGQFQELKEAKEGPAKCSNP